LCTKLQFQIFIVVGRLIKECNPPNLDISVTLYGKGVLVLREFELRGKFQGRRNRENKALPRLPSRFTVYIQVGDTRDDDSERTDT
jgi:hypothetical protein